MGGVGSTNAMKKGSANNPFLAFSEADMKGYLNSAYTGCIVKYNGDPIARKITFANSNIPERAQNLVFTRNAPTFGDYGFGDLVITKKQNGSTTTEYLRCAYCNLLTGLIGPLSSGTPSGDNYVKFIGLFSSNSNLIRACWVPDAIDSKYEYPDWWPVTPGWQEDFVNTEGKVVEWGYGEDVVFTYSGDSDAVLLVPCVITPYEVGELYKVVYGDNEYYYEEFYYISEDKTTAGVEDVAPGKTFYDFTGTKQTGTGTRANPFLARGDSDMNAFNNATYLGKFVKYIGKTNDTYIKNAIYQVTNDATEYDRYMLLPTLENEGKASDLAQGKQLINSKGEVVEGTVTDDIDYTQDVMFWDYDGKLLYACTLAEAKAMTELPAVPDHSDKGLVFLKWNYTLDDIQNIEHGADIGALYDTADGKTHLFFDIVSDLTKTVTLYIIKSYTSQVADLTIDWGDGTDIETYEWDKNTTPSSANFPTHTYSNLGQYEVKLENTSTYTRQNIYLGSIDYSISDARNLFGLTLRYGATNIVSTILTKAYLGERIFISCGACVNLTEISLRLGSLAPCGLQKTQVKHVNVANSINLYAFRYSAIQTFSCSATSIEPAAFLSYSAIKRIACKAYTQIYADATSLELPSLQVCIWPRTSSYRLQLVIQACKKVVLKSVVQWDNSASSASLNLLVATKLYMNKFLPYGNNTTIAAGIISAPMLEQFIIDNATPMPLTAAFTNIPATCKYYVPDSAVDDYKAAAGWSDMADRIYPMSELI